MQNYPMNLFFATAWLIMLVYVFSPDTVGEWQAKRDIAHDRVWGEWIMDCDCADSLEESL